MNTEQGFFFFSPGTCILARSWSQFREAGKAVSISLFFPLESFILLSISWHRCCLPRTFFIPSVSWIAAGKCSRFSRFVYFWLTCLCFYRGSEKATLQGTSATVATDRPTSEKDEVHYINLRSVLGI